MRRLTPLIGALALVLPIMLADRAPVLAIAAGIILGLLFMRLSPPTDLDFGPVDLIDLPESAESSEPSTVPAPTRSVPA